jgi:putative polyketide hydroxylase
MYSVSNGSTKVNSTSVLVVGGGLVGLSSALFLAWRGVPTVLVERHAGSSPHPRAIGYTARTMENLRAVGLGDRVPQAPVDFRLRRTRVESLAGKWFEESAWTPARDDARKIADAPKIAPAPKIAYSPCAGAAIAQDRLEPILRDRAIELGADVRLSTELLGFEQDGDGVTATLRAPDGETYPLRAAYLVAADGLRSPIREALGIGRAGRGHMRTVRSVLFRAPLESYLEAGVHQFEIEQPDFKAFLTTYLDGRWVLIFADDVERDEATLRALVHKAIGCSDLPIELVTTGRWELSALIADRFSSGRVFLAGDAAHTLPPARGGYGANTGIEDAHNLAWKLAAVLAGQSTPALLDSYDAERRTIAWLRHDQIFARPDYRAEVKADAVAVPIIDDDAMELGQLYRSSAVLGADAGLPPALRPDQWAGQPGVRAPHLWVTQGGERRSTLDLFGHGWVLLTEDEAWRPIAARAGAALGLALSCVRVGGDVQPADEAAFRTAFGLEPGGATLVRPDGYVAWRAKDRPADPLRALTDAWRSVASAVKRVTS